MVQLRITSGSGLVALKLMTMNQVFNNADLHYVDVGVMCECVDVCVQFCFQLYVYCVKMYAFCYYNLKTGLF